LEKGLTQRGSSIPAGGTLADGQLLVERGANRRVRTVRDNAGGAGRERGLDSSLQGHVRSRA